MEFRLNEYHRNISDEELIEDMISVAKSLSVATLTKKQYVEHGKFNISTIEKRFNGWKKACIKAGFKLNIKQMNNVIISNEDIVADIIDVANKLNKNTLLTSEYDEFGKHSLTYLLSRFKTWENALLNAGLKPTGYHSKLADKELFDELERVWETLCRQPTSKDFKNGVFKYSQHAYLSHFGTWRKALEAFVEYINDDNRDEDETSAVEHSNETIAPVIYNKPNDTHKTKRDINLRLRFKVMQRDNFKCCMCGASPATDSSVVLHIDHIKPWSKGGETVIENLQTLCSKCNLGKSDLEL